MFSCECMDYVIYNNICKHIHLLSWYIAQNTEMVDDRKEVHVKQNTEVEINILGQFVCEKKNSESFQHLKERTESEIMKLLGNVQQCMPFDKEALQNLFKAVSKVNNTSLAL